MVEIKDKELLDYVKTILNNYNNITVEDLEKIDEIIIDQIDIAGQYNEIYFEDIKLFPNLKSLILRNLDIEETEYNNYIKNLDLKILEFNNCNFPSLTEFKNIERLSIINSGFIDINAIKTYTSLKHLILQNIIIPENILDNLNLSYLDLRFSKIDDLKFLMNNKNKLILYIDKELYINNMDLINSLKEKNVTLYIDERFIFGDEASNDDI